MTHPIHYLLGAACVAFIGWQTTVAIDPRELEGLQVAASLISGNSACMGAMFRQNVYMPMDGNCEPVGVLVAGPKAAINMGLGYNPDDVMLMMVNPDAMGFYRQVSVNAIYTEERFLAEGGEIPEAISQRRKAFQKWADASSRRAAACALLPEDFAKRCDISEVRVKVDRLQPGQLFAVQYSLAFSMAAPIGPLPQSEEALALDVQMADLPADPALSQGERVAKAVALATETCKPLQAANGNCMISRIITGELGDTHVEVITAGLRKKG